MRWSIVRIATAIIALTGVAAGLFVNIDRATRQGQDLGLVLANYFSFFTVLTAILCVVVMVAAVSGNHRNPAAQREPFGISVSLAIVTGPVLLLGIVFNVLLRGLPSAEALADSAGIHMLDVWATETLHVALPVLLVADLLFAPRRRGLPWWSLGALMAYPIAWLGYTLVRGARTPDPAGTSSTWYPYPFLNPTGDAGWNGVLTYIAIMLALLFVINAGVIAIGRYRDHRRHIGVDSTVT